MYLHYRCELHGPHTLEHTLKLTLERTLECTLERQQ